MKRRSEDNDATEAIRPLVREVIKGFLKTLGIVQRHEKKTHPR